MPIPDQLDIKSRLILVAIGPVFSVRQRASCRLGSGPFLVASSLIIKSIPLHPISSQITFARDNLVSDHFDFVSKAMAPCSKLSQTSPMVSQNWRLCVRTSSASSTSSGHCTCHHQWPSCRTAYVHLSSLRPRRGVFNRSGHRQHPAAPRMTRGHLSAVASAVPTTMHGDWWAASGNWPTAAWLGGMALNPVSAGPPLLQQTVINQANKHQGPQPRAWCWRRHHRPRA